MLGNEAHAADVANAINTASLGAGAANGPWHDVRNFEGDLEFVIPTGAITGSVVYKVQDATDIAGTGAADLTPAVQVNGVANASAKLVVNKSATRGFVRLVATVTTGPVLAGATLQSRPKNI